MQILNTRLEQIDINSVNFQLFLNLFDIRKLKMSDILPEGYQLGEYDLNKSHELCIFIKSFTPPISISLGENQVAGHTVQVGNDEVGLLKREADASVLKPEGSPLCASREIKFYENVKKDENDEDIQM